MHTEEQARSKWCPAARARDRYYEGVSVNRGSSDAEADAKCIASDCMWWRWNVEHRVVAASDSVSEDSVEIVQSDKGFCGRGGVPSP